MRPIASLSPALLARKGQARPAMRAPALDDGQAGEDLGWNDMGAPGLAAEPEAIRPQPAELPPVLVERAELTLDVARIARTGAVVARAAFTLRLPTERHLRLRLASAVLRRSAQTIVTEALDAFLSTLPEVEELAHRCSCAIELEDRS